MVEKVVPTKKYRKSKEFVCPYCRKDFDKLSKFKRHSKDAHRIIIRISEAYNPEDSVDFNMHDWAADSDTKEIIRVEENNG